MRTTPLTTLLAAALALACAPQGPQGPRGPAGEQGETGPAGDDGEDGPPGVGGGDARVIEADTTWSGAETLERLVYVMPGVTLTVEAGTTVTLLPEAGLVVDGVLVADGGPSSAIVFESGSSFDDSLLGVKLGATDGDPQLDNVVFDAVGLEVRGDGLDGLAFATFEDAGLVIRDRGEPFDLSNTTFTWSGSRGVSVTARDPADLSLVDVDIAGGRAGIDLLGTAAYDVDLDDLGVTGTAGAGIVLEGPQQADSTLFARDLILRDLGGDGLRSQEFQLDVAGVLVEDVERSGLRTNDHADPGPSTLSDITVRRTGDDCLLVTYGATASTIVAEDCGGEGLRVGGAATLSDITVVRPASQGIWLGHGTLTRCSVTDGDSSGVIVYDKGEPTTISLCDLRDNAWHGVHKFGNSESPPFAPAAVESSNIVGNGGYAAFGIQQLDGCHVADNNGETGTDLGSGGTVDDVFDTTTDQAHLLDAIFSPQSDTVAGTGPAAP